MSDLVGSTRLVDELGDLRATALFQRHDRIARDLLSRHQGREIDKSDGFLLLFEKPANAVLYAMGYHEALRELSREADLELLVRIGIHFGEVVLYRNSPDDVERGAKPLEVEGLAKFMVARLMSLAHGKQTLLTHSAFDMAQRGLENPSEDLRWVAHGTYLFQGVDEEVPVFEVGLEGRAPLDAPLGSDKARLVRRRADRAEVQLRRWPPPELPELPYPLLLPYRHPDLLAGRERELARLKRMLSLPVPILGLYAPSGAGKSSFLGGCLVPRLREAGWPVAFERHPQERGLAMRLLGDLLSIGSDSAASSPSSTDLFSVGDERYREFLDRLGHVRAMAGKPAILVLDQCEELLSWPDLGRARAILGALLAATVERRPGAETPPCRWILAYRQEYHGELVAWLGDALADAEREGLAAPGLPHDLSLPDRFHSLALPPLGTPPAGSDEPLGDATKAFRAALEKPLELRRDDASPVYRLSFGGDGAQRLARAFAETRLSRPEAPLTPELQVVLAHLLNQALERGERDAEGLLRIDVPEQPGQMIEAALEDHLRRTLEQAFPAERAEARRGRARALLALRELAAARGRRGDGLPADELTRMIGHDGLEIIDKLSTPRARLVITRWHPEGWRYALSHDRLAEVVVKLVEQEGRSERFEVDSELLALRRFVALSSALFRSEPEQATSLSRRRYRAIAANSEALVVGQDRQIWWKACRRRRRLEWRRTMLKTTTAAVLVTLLAATAWGLTRSHSRRQALFEQISTGEPAVALAALDAVLTGDSVDRVSVLTSWLQRESPSDVLERGLGSIDGKRRGAAVLRVAELAASLAETSLAKGVGQRPALVSEPRWVAGIVWALDVFARPEPQLAERARDLRERLLVPLRRRHRPPPAAFDHPRWIRPPADNESAAYRMLDTEVASAELRRLFPEHPGIDPAEPSRPAMSVDWYEAYTYAAWLGGRLPTRAEWDHAARAGCPYEYCDRAGRETVVNRVAWTRNNAFSADTYEPYVHPTGQLEPNPWGFYDLYGNAEEWVADWYVEAGNGTATANDDGRRRGPPATSGTGRATCGAGVWDRVEWAQPGGCQLRPPAQAAAQSGFRVVIPESWLTGG